MIHLAVRNDWHNGDVVCGGGGVDVVKPGYKPVTFRPTSAPSVNYHATPQTATASNAAAVSSDSTEPISNGMNC